MERDIHISVFSADGSEHKKYKAMLGTTSEQYTEYIKKEVDKGNIVVVGDFNTQIEELLLY